jgi:hypothetical protein
MAVSVSEMASKRGSPAQKGGGAKKVAGRPKGSRTRAPSAVKRGGEANAGAAGTVETAELYRAIYTDWVQGWSWHALAVKHGLSERRCQEVVEDLRDSNVSVLGMRDQRMGLRIAEDLILRRNEAISQAAELAQEARERGNLSVALGALRRRDEAIGELTALLQALGYLPRNLAGLAWKWDVIEMAETAIAVLNDGNVPQEIQERFVRAMDLRTKPDPSGSLELDMRVPAYEEVTEDLLVR